MSGGLITMIMTTTICNAKCRSVNMTIESFSLFVAHMKNYQRVAIGPRQLPGTIEI